MPRPLGHERRQRNREVYGLLKDGVKVTFKDDDGGQRTETYHLITRDDRAIKAVVAALGAQAGAVTRNGGE